jgi:hypothetical protein
MAMRNHYTPAGGVLSLFSGDTRRSVLHGYPRYSPISAQNLETFGECGGKRSATPFSLSLSGLTPKWRRVPSPRQRRTSRGEGVRRRSGTRRKLGHIGRMGPIKPKGLKVCFTLPFFQGGLPKIHNPREWDLRTPLFVIPTKVGIQGGFFVNAWCDWIPAFAGMTVCSRLWCVCFVPFSLQ